MGRPGQPCEVATCYVFLASEDASYIRCVHAAACSADKQLWTNWVLLHLIHAVGLWLCACSGQTLHPNGGTVVNT